MTFPVFNIVYQDALKLAMDHRACFSREPDFTALHPLSLQNRFKVLRKGHPPVCIGNKTGKGPGDQQLSICSQQLRAGEIHILYQSGRIEGEIADRCKVIESGIFISRYFKLPLDPDQLFVLHLQFDLLILKLSLDPAQFRVLLLHLDLVDLEFLDDPLRAG